MTENDTGSEPEVEGGEPHERGAGPSSPQATISIGKSAVVPPARAGMVTFYYDGTNILMKLPDGTVRPLDPGSAPSYTAANIAAVAHAVNTSGKGAGKQVFDTTNNRIMRATGALAASTWKTLDGVTTVTPA